MAVARPDEGLVGQAGGGASGLTHALDNVMRLTVISSEDLSKTHRKPATVCYGGIVGPSPGLNEGVMMIDEPKDNRDGNSSQSQKTEKTDRRHEIDRAYAVIMEGELDGRRARAMRQRRLSIVKS